MTILKKLEENVNYKKKKEGNKPFFYGFICAIMNKDRRIYGIREFR